MTFESHYSVCLLIWQDVRCVCSATATDIAPKRKLLAAHFSDGESRQSSPTSDPLFEKAYHPLPITALP